MAGNATVIVGTSGEGMFKSTDGGETWGMLHIRNGLHSEGVVRAIVNHPSQREIIYAGTDKGVYRTDDLGESWRLLDSPLNDYVTWSLAIDPQKPDVVFAGTGTPSAPTLFRSKDGGETWERRPFQVAEECPNVSCPRITAIAVDPVNRQNVWMGIEVDGVRRSTDGGDTWETINGAIPNRDVHNLAIAPGRPSTVFVVVSDDVFISRDDGATWKSIGVPEKFPWGYPRGIRIHPENPDVVFLTIGDTFLGRVGSVMRSTDAGSSWEELPLPVQPNSAMWVVNVEPPKAQTVYAGSIFGYLYRSDDGGNSWKKLWREFPEIASVLCIPG
jgi:photosystem II stability/assembly factor-like uncharacterized protein